MSFLKNKSGYTLMESMTVMGVLSILIVGSMSMFTGALRSFEGTTVQSSTDMDAVIAMQRIVNDVREAKRWSINSNNTTLQLTYPKTAAQGYYDKSQLDATSRIDYYLSDSTGFTNRTGTYLWRSKGGVKRKVSRNIESLIFEQAGTDDSLRITVVSKNKTPDGYKRTELTERVVYLRNY